MPQAYKDGTFWCSNQAAFFKLKIDVNADQKNVLQPRVFLWFPHHLFYEANKKFKCPECSKKKAVPEFMNNDGYTKSPLAQQIIDIKEIIGTDIELIRQLPLIAQAEFSAFLTKKSGISRDLAYLIRLLMQSSNGPLRLSNILQELHTKRYDTLQYQYLANYKHRVDNPGMRPLPVPAPEFPKFNDKYGYNGYHGVNVFDALYTVTDEYEEIRLQSFVPTKSLVHLIGSFDKMYDTYNMYGYTLPKLFYTDNVRSDRHFLEEHLPSLLENVQHVDGLPVAAIPSNVEIFVDNAVQEINDSCDRILRDYHDLPILVHFKKCTRNERCIARISLETFNFEVFIFKITNNIFPSGLRKLFEEENINKIGNRLNALISSLNEKSPALQLQLKNTTEWTTYCSNRYANSSGSTIKDFCQALLNEQFPREQTLVESALETFYMIKLYSKARTIETSFTRFDQEPSVGTYVAIFPMNSVSMIPSAYGYIREKTSQEFGPPMRRNLQTNSTALVEITAVLKPNMRLPEHGLRKTLANTGCANPFIVVKKSMLRKCSESHDSGNVVASSGMDARVGRIDNTGDLQHYEQQQLSNDQDDEFLDTTSDTVVYKSRILKDVFHLIDMLKIPKNHSLCAEFKRKFRDILLVPDPVDKDNVTRF
ncbi:hypothetical protein [Parasitella parasitica]|uniref:DUF6729 domain-containing protein n=1 Tax=Parasitella parasitica TaxID=35722 RepID=A0A0B7MYB0_9FUNG|nr:hypothetical protein [Parasitella parasitica]